VIAFVSILLAAFVPVAIFLVIAAGLVLTVWILPRVIRFFRDAWRRLRRWFSPSPA
jgi:hypothetical protein